MRKETTKLKANSPENIFSIYMIVRVGVLTT